MTGHASLKRWVVTVACVTVGVMLVACSRVPQDVSVAAFNYTDRPISVSIDGADAGYTAVGEGGGSACCYSWPDKPEIWVKWEYGGIEDEKVAKYPPQSKRVKVPPLPDCWKPGTGVYLVAHVYPGHRVRLEALTGIGPWPEDKPSLVKLDATRCQISVKGEVQ